MSPDTQLSLQALGWNSFFESHRHLLAPPREPARVVAEHREAFRILNARGSWLARTSGRLRHQATSRLDLPAVGDWVGTRVPGGDGEAVIDVVLPRASRLVRQAAGTAVLPQVVAANVDLVVVVSSLDCEFNRKRLERWAALIDAAGAIPLLLLNKADLCSDPEPFLDDARRAMPDARILLASAATGDGLEPLRQAVGPGLTAALVGSSGVGKSTTLNALLGSDVQATLAVRDHDGRGRHATTHRELFVLPGGGLVIDTPGLRELAAWADGDDAPGGETLPEVDAFAGACHFRDCSHASEPGCGVRAAVERGELDADRLASFEKLRREMAWQATRQDEAAARAARQRWKAITRSMRGFDKGRR